MQIEQNIVTAFQLGDLEAFKTLYELTKLPIFALINRMTAQHHEAEDLLHDVYLRVYEKRGLYKSDKASIYTWLYQMAVNYTLNYLRNKKHWDSNIVVEQVTEDDFVHKEDGALALELLQKINPDFRVCLVLCDVEEYSYQDIAEMLNISIGTVRSRINRGRKELKSLFDLHS